MNGPTSQVLKGVVILSVVVLITLAERHYQVSAYLNPPRIEEWLIAAGFLASFVYVLVLAAAVVVSPISGLPPDIVAGSFFGPVLRTLYASIGALIGAVGSFPAKVAKKIKEANDGEICADEP